LVNEFVFLKTHNCKRSGSADNKILAITAQAHLTGIFLVERCAGMILVVATAQKYTVFFANNNLLSVTAFSRFDIFDASLALCFKAFG
jgi:hypothetical protein